MGISAIGGSTSIMSFQQINRKVDSEHARVEFRHGDEARLERLPAEQ